MKTWGPLLLFLAVCVLIPIHWKYGQKRAQRLLEQWASENGFQVIDKDRFGFNSPFKWWTTSGRQLVWRVTVRNRRGVFLTGSVRFGSYWGGLSSDKVEVKWDNPTLLDL